MELWEHSYRYTPGALTEETQYTNTRQLCPLYLYATHPQQHFVTGFMQDKILCDWAGAEALIVTECNSAMAEAEIRRSRIGTLEV